MLKKVKDIVKLEKITPVLWQIGKALLIVIVGHFVIKYLLKLIRKFFVKAKLDKSLSKFLLKTIDITLHIIVVLSALSAIGISTTGLLAALSAAAVGVALALKDSLSNIAGGILLLISPRFATGDFISAAGESGTVKQVDLMHTILKTPDNRHVIIPNGMMMGSQTVNFSKEESRRLDMTFVVSYDSDVELAKKIIRDTAESHPLLQAQIADTFVRVGEYTLQGVSIAARVWCRAADYAELNSDLLENIRVEFDKSGVTMAHNHMKPK